jgi:pimeloyl-ACP methyl ester carboxylesterase
MRGLQPPPKQDTPSRIAARLIGLVLLVAAAGTVIYTAVTNQNIDLVEDVRAAGLELDDPSEVAGLTVNVFEEAGDGVPVVFLHDTDPAGSLTLAPLAEALPDGYRSVRIDMPGFGYSERIPSEGPEHTAATMGENMAVVIEERFDIPVILVGVGFGGQVAAEAALAAPEALGGLVLVDVDFDVGSSWLRLLETVPWVGKAATYTWETGGRFALDNWSPHCEEGGWCPTPDERAERTLIISIEDTTASLHGFLRTPPAALAPTNLEDISVPVAYVRSTEGDVTEETVDGLAEDLADLSVLESGTFQAHLEDHDTVIEAIASVAGN